MIYTAASDGEDRLRYPAEQDAIDKIAKRHAEGNEAFIDDIRCQFQVHRTLEPVA